MMNEMYNIPDIFVDLRLGLSLFRRHLASSASFLIKIHSFRKFLLLSLFIYSGIFFAIYVLLIQL